MPAQITALPTPPSTNDPANFNTRADAFLGQMPTFVTQANVLTAEVNANAQAAAGSATSAQNTADAVALKVAEAAASASSALNAPGTNGTSTTSLTIGTGAKSFTAQTGKAWSIGQSLAIANTAAPTNRMIGVLTAYNSGTGAATVQVTTAEGSGTFTAWTISMAAGAPMAVASQAEAEAGTDNSKVLTPLRGAQQIAKLAMLRGDAPVTSITTLTASSAYSQTFKGTDFGAAFILPDATTLPTGPRFSFTNDSAYDLTIRDSTGVARRFLAPKETCVAILQENAGAGGVWRWTGGHPLGMSARHPTSFAGNGNAVGEGVFQVRLDATRDLIIYCYYLGSTTYYKAVIYDRPSNTFGATLSITSFASVSAVSGFIRAKLIGADKVLLVYMSSATQATAYVLTTSGLNVAAGAPTVATVGTSFNVSNSTLFDIETLGSTHVLSMVDGGVYLRVCGITISGSTATFGTSTLLGTAAVSMGNPSNDLCGVAKTNAGGVPTLFMTLNNDTSIIVRMVTFSGTTPTVTGTFASSITSGATQRAALLPSGSVAVFAYDYNAHVSCAVYYWTGSAWSSAVTDLSVLYGWTGVALDIRAYVSVRVVGANLLANYFTASGGKISALQFTEGASGALTLVGSAVVFDLSNLSPSDQKASWVVTHRDGDEVFSFGATNNLRLFLKTTPGVPANARLSSTPFQASNGIQSAIFASDIGMIARSSDAMVAGKSFVSSAMTNNAARKCWTLIDGDLALDEPRVDMRGLPVSSVYKYQAILKDGADRSDIWAMVPTYESGNTQFYLSRYEVAA